MKIIYSAKTLDWRLILEDDADYSCAVDVENLLSGRMICKKCGTISSLRSWEFLKKCFSLCREALIESQKQSWRTRIGRTLADLKDAQMDGFDKATMIPQDLVNQAKLMQEMTKKKEATHHAPRSDDDEI